MLERSHARGSLAAPIAVSALLAAGALALALGVLRRARARAADAAADAERGGTAALH